MAYENKCNKMFDFGYLIADTVFRRMETDMNALTLLIFSCIGLVFLAVQPLFDEYVEAIAAILFKE